MGYLAKEREALIRNIAADEQALDAIRAQWEEQDPGGCCPMCWSGGVYGPWYPIEQRQRRRQERLAIVEKKLEKLREEAALPKKLPPREFDASRYFLYFYRGGKDSSEQLVAVPKDVFDRLLPHEEALANANAPHEIQELAGEQMRLEAIDARNSEFALIPDDHFIRVTLV